jgi:glycosyltransferase involved in cell wall biosynthesis
LERVGAVSDVQSQLEDTEMELATRIVVASDYSRESLIQNGIEDRRIAVIPYGVDTDVFLPGGDGGVAKPVLLFVGNLTQEKGVFTLLEAWRELNTSGGELWLAGPINPMVRRMANQMNGVRLLGKLDREQLVGAYQRATAFVFPTFYDGFGLVLLEAIACGLPIVATRSCAAPDLIKEGAPGMLCTAGDSMGLAVVLADVLSKPGSWNKGRVAARKTAKRYSWAEYGRHWADLIGGMSA